MPEMQEQFLARQISALRFAPAIPAFAPSMAVKPLLGFSFLQKPQLIKNDDGREFMSTIHGAHPTGVVNDVLICSGQISEPCVLS